jgi:hypothetical protein
MKVRYFMCENAQLFELYFFSITKMSLVNYLNNTLFDALKYAYIDFTLILI